MFIWPILLIVLIVVAVWYMRGGGAPAGLLPTVPGQPAGLEVLSERYARGEIGRDEYLQKKQDLG